MVSFGPYRLWRSERLLERDGLAVTLGGRAFDLLVVLVSAAGHVVSKRELMATVWPGVSVEEGSLRFHVAALRRALGLQEGGTQYIVNVPGRGYSFVAPLTADVPSSAPTRSPARHEARLPPRPSGVVGRDETLGTLCAALEAARFVSVIGSGGIGKTTMALLTAHQLQEDFDGEVYFVDFASVNEPTLAVGALSSALGLSPHSVDPSDVVEHLRERRLLLVLDGCEHVIDVVAPLTEELFERAPQVRILVTSREALRVVGESVFRIEPLECPAAGSDPSVAELLTFSATRLFIERATASGLRVELSSTDAATVAEICRQLDGIALAIELAAGRVEAYGIQSISELLTRRLSLLMHGRRTAVPRHQTMEAMLDWSYALLASDERLTLRRLSMLAGRFFLDDALALAADSSLDETTLVVCIGNLVDKSLLIVDASHGSHPQYRMLDTTRAFAAQRLIEDSEADDVALRHAQYFCAVLESGQDDRQSRSVEVLVNVRSALDWALARRGNPTLGIALAAAASRVFLGMSLMAECRHWVQLALDAPADVPKSAAQEMQLYVALGHCLQFTGGSTQSVSAALAHGSRLAQQLGDMETELRILGALQIWHHRIGDFRGALEIARRAESVAQRIDTAGAHAIANSMLSVATQMMGDLTQAQRHWDRAVRSPRVPGDMDTIGLGFDHRIRGMCAAARRLWLSGLAQDAVAAATLAIEEAELLRNPVTLRVACLWTASIFVWVGDMDSALGVVQRIVAHVKKFALEPHRSLTSALEGELLISRGDHATGLPLLRDSLKSLAQERHEFFQSELVGVMADGLTATGNLDDAMRTCEEALARTQRIGDLIQMSNLLRIKGDVLAARGGSAWPQAEESFLQAIEWATRQKALSLELRATTSLARCYDVMGRHDEAYARLCGVYARFTQGFDTTDLIAAKRLIDSLRGKSGNGRATIASGG